MVYYGAAPRQCLVENVMAIRDEVRALVPFSFLSSLVGMSRKERVDCIYEILHVGGPAVAWHHWV